MIENKIFEISSENTFETTALEVFRWQHEHVPVYRKFCDLLQTDPQKVKSVAQIPFLPIAFFKHENIIAHGTSPKIAFTSSGTTGQQPSTHLVANPQLYEKSFLEGFRMAYGDPENWTILALLPSYLEREGSSLIYMVDALIKRSNHPESGFYLDEYDALASTLHQLEEKGQKTLLMVYPLPYWTLLPRIPSI